MSGSRSRVAALTARLVAVSANGASLESRCSNASSLAAYSGFEGKTTDGVPLLDWLRGHKVEEVDICGIATDYCVRATALDAAKAGFRTTVLTDLCAGVAPETTEKALSEFAQASITAHAITGR